MERYRIMIVLLAAAALLFPAEKLTIVDYYRLIPEKSIKNSRFILTQKNGVYVTPSITENELRPTVDIPNGYLLVEDPGTGGGTTGHECAVFIDASSKAYIALNQYSFDGASGEQTLSVFVYRDGTLIDRTADCAPKISFAAFLIKPDDAKRIQNIIKQTHLYMIDVKLPRYGTDVKATLTVFNGKIEAFASSPDGKKMKAECAALASAPTYTTIVYNWDKQKAVFVAGERK